MEKTGIFRFGKALAVCSALMFIFAGAADAQSQEDVKNALFTGADEALNDAMAKDAARYAPKTFRKGKEAYDKAERDLEKGKSLESIQKRLNQAVEYFNEASEIAAQAAVIFKTTAEARYDALSAEAPSYATDTWKEAEEELADATEEFEAGDLKDAKEKGKAAEDLYRKAELNAIKVNYLQGGWALLKRAENMKVDKTAPDTLEKAQTLMERSEKLLEMDRYDTKEVRELSQRAKYEANHAIRIHELISRHEDKKNVLEEALLESETPVHEVADLLDVRAQYDEGYKAAAKEIVEAIGTLQKENAGMARSLKEKDAEIAGLQDAMAQTTSEKDNTIREKESEILTLHDKIASLRDEIGSLKNSSAQMSVDMQQQRARREKVARIRDAFNPDEGYVLQDTDGNIILRLYGLTFQSGKSSIEPKYFGLLTKVISAIGEFPGASVIIEGHTDSIGSASKNLKLSSDRAVTVKQYILANTDLASERIEAVGFGDARPVASNKTKEGQAKNRRIDVTIIPAK